MAIWTMRRPATVLFSIGMGLLVTNVVQAANWPAKIKQMERSGANKKQLAIAYNNYALSLSANDRWNDAEANLRRALRLDPRNNDLKRNLATTLMNHASSLTRSRKKNDRHANAQALKLANEALRYKPKWAEAYVLIGDVEYSDQRLDRAKLAWTKAKQLSPSSQPIQKRLQRLENESVVEQQFDKGGSAYFDLRFDRNIRSSTAYDLTSVLMQARQDIGREFHFWPDRRIVVLIYSSANFDRVHQGPDWVAGIYDGKIRLRYPDSAAALDSVHLTLVHEYTHALIHNLAGGKCPAWLNEGLAEYQEAKIRPPKLDALRIAMRSNRLIPLEELNRALRDDDPRTAWLAYQQSHSMVAYLVQKYKLFRLTRVLQHLAAGRSVEVALNQELRLATDQLEEDWQNWLHEFIRH